VKLDNASHPVSQAAMRVFFACFIAGAIMGLSAASQNRMLQSPAFCLCAAIVALLAVCSLITYFRPRGLPAFITSTAYVGVFLIGGIFVAGSELRNVDQRWSFILGSIILLAWVLRGISAVRAARQAARELDQRS